MKKKMMWFIEILLVIIGLALVFNQQISDMLVNKMTTTDLKKSVSQKHAKKGSFDFNRVKSASASRVVKASLTSESTGMIGKIAVPAVNLKLPIFYGISNNNLLRGAGTMKAKQKMGTGNYALAGHHMNNPNILFSPLAKAKVGDKVYLTDGKEVYVYQINVRKSISKYQVQVIDDVAGKKMVTLITCDPIKGVAHTPLRILLQGNLQKVEKVTKNNAKIFE
ncbi:class A sortase [Liquorilactobacillus mali]|uniref:class A sortase n=1 Tax=Liquorilactobacillus mali TaxID=1618 RepID=UPI002953045D|nr:class A sortase [Liquorilactobacillus mali]MDV7757218.1 sortase [Liquorilactobacillus mali]